MKVVLYISLITFLLNACKPMNERRCAKKTGDITTTLLPNINAHKVILYDDIALTLVQDSLNYVEIVGGENIIPFVDVKIENETIEFKNSNRCNFTRKLEPLTAYYHCTNVDSVFLYGYGDLSNDGVYKNNLYIGSYESFSSIVLNLDNDKTEISGQVGSIDAKLSGKCNYLFMYSNGSGFMDASNLECKTSHGHSQGIGDFTLFATEEIIVELRSRGDFYLKHPDNVNKQITDEGEGNIYNQ